MLENSVLTVLHYKLPYIEIRPLSITSNTSVINQRVNPSKRFPRGLYRPFNCGAIRGDVQLHCHGPGTSRLSRRRRRRTRRRRRSVGIIDLITKRFEPVNAPSRGDDSTAGFGEIKTEFPAYTRGGSGYENHLVGEVGPWLQL